MSLSCEMYVTRAVGSVWLIRTALAVVRRIAKPPYLFN